MILATGLWLNKGKNGTYMSGTMGGVRVLIFKNEKKVEGSKQPDYNLVFAENKPKEKSDDNAKQESSIPEFEPRADNPFGGDSDSSEIPF